MFAFCDSSLSSAFVIKVEITFSLIINTVAFEISKNIDMILNIKYEMLSRGYLIDIYPKKINMKTETNGRTNRNNEKSLIAS